MKWNGLDVEQIDDDSVAALTNRCHLQSVSFDEMKHRRNVNSVVSFMKRLTS